MSQEKLLQYIHHNRHSNTLLVQHNTKLINKLRTENTPLIQENTRKIDQLMADNTALMQSQDNNKEIDLLRIQNQNNNKQINQLRTEIDNIKAETSPFRQLIAENPHLIEQLISPLPGEWDVQLMVYIQYVWIWLL